MKHLFLWVFLLVFSVVTLGQEKTDLPNYLTEHEKELLKTYKAPVSTEASTLPPSFTARTIAEWEEMDGVMITWTSHTSILSQIVDYAQEEGLVYIVTGDSNSVKSYLTNQGVPLVNLKFVIASYNSIWCRDYGAWTIYKDYSEQRSSVDWTYNRPRPSDDQVPVALTNYMGMDLYQTTSSPYELVNTGGNFMTDGHGTGFASKLVLNENTGLSESEIDNILYEFMGIDRYIKMNTLPYDDIHHIDMHMKLLDEETLLVGQYPEGVADGPQIEANLQYVLENFKTCFGRDYKVVRIPMPPDASGSYPNSWGDYRTYTNSLIINKTVIVPTYETYYDTTALRIYREAMPGYNVVGIDCNSIIPQLGAIHCITKEIGMENPIFISHAKLLDTHDAGPFEVKAFMNTPTGINSAKVFWSNNPDGPFSEVSMSVTTNDTLVGEIPAQERGDYVYYYIEAENNEGHVSHKPLTAPEGWMKFKVLEEQYTEQVAMNAGWNLVSVPVNSSDMSYEYLFTNSSSAVYNFNGAYYISETAEPGKACWVKYPQAESVSVTGAKFEQNIELESGWNMVGPFDEAMPVASLVTEPAGIISTPFYGFNDSYTTASTLEAGKGYWVKTSQAGEILVGVAKKGNITNDITKRFEYSLTIVDASGKSKTLYLTEKNSNNAAYELPPLPPADAFDARFSNNLMVAGINDAADILLQGAEYPVKITSGEDVVINGMDASQGIVLNNATQLKVSVVTIPNEFALEQNYPNPFNPATTINFNLPVDTDVNIAVYNQLGEKVTELVNGKLSAGVHKVKFNAGNLPSGIYIYRLSAGSFTQSRKMLLMK